MNQTETAEKRAYDYIRDRIIAKEYLPRERIVENDVSEKTGVSRTPVRVALRKLSYEGLVTIRPNRGTFVTSPTPEEIRDVFECRKYIEASVVRLACGRMTGEGIDWLESVIQQEPVAYANQDFSGFVSLNGDIHLLIAEAAHNSFFTKIVEELLTRCGIYLLFFSNFRVERFEDWEPYQEHRAILDALKRRDAGACEQAMKDHIDRSYARILNNR